MTAAGKAWSPLAVLEIVLRLHRQQQDDRVRHHGQMMKDKVKEYQHRRQHEQLLQVLRLSARAGDGVSHHDGARTCAAFEAGDTLDNTNAKILDIFTASGKCAGVRGRDAAAADDYNGQKPAAARQVDVEAAVTAAATVAKEQEVDRGASDATVMKESVSQAMPGGPAAPVAADCVQKEIMEQPSGPVAVFEVTALTEPMEQQSGLASARDCNIQKENSVQAQRPGSDALGDCLQTEPEERSGLAVSAIDYNIQKEDSWQKQLGGPGVSTPCESGLPHGENVEGCK